MINKKNLKAGIKYWINKKKNWPDDFHNKLYKELHQLKEKGLTQEWWKKVVEKLHSWYANRPRSKKTILNSGLPYIEQLNQASDKIVLLKGAYPELKGIEKDKIENLFNISQKIKETKSRSPVFPSKLCHFIFPTVFFVADREAVGIKFNDYFNYWNENRNLWVNTENKKDLIQIIKQKIAESQQFDGFFQYYPYGVKIAELCRIGLKQKNKF